MTLTSLRLGAGAQTLTLKRYTAQPNDAEGNPVAATETVLATLSGLIQPTTSEFRDEAFSPMEHASDTTHWGFIQTRVAGLKVTDHVVDAAGNNYLIVYVHDFGGNIPQQLDLKIVTDVEPVT